ncbi:MAG TPA: 3-isopropylmalate dehydratase small subunit [Acidimicrobiia bacterium]|nr:3-isopropylmalate dehydratase small subunit [Acidimicrobiia bacterium]
MQPITTITGSAVPLPRANIDTDQIIPKQFLKRVERSGFGEFLFYDWARDAEGELDPDFVLNDPAYAAATILVTGPNFGSGSSREHAPWSLEDWGFRAVIAPSFADIFANNCTKIDLLPIVLTDDEVAALIAIARDPEAQVTIDLPAQTVKASGFSASFDIDPFTKHCLVNGLDHIALTMRNEEEIDRFEAVREAYKPVTA